jgi:2-polyprenyl-6-hydroxyphenyl methylase/3-demethylubiquinone-9 3-methyltransferase
VSSPDPSDLFRHACGQLERLRQQPVVPCKICGAAAEMFDMVDFNKSCDASLYPRGLIGVPVVYHACPDCKFIFTTFFDAFPPAWWTRFVYNEQYAEVDPEYVDKRPRANAAEIGNMLRGRRDVVGLEYGGGRGLTAALLREKGFAFDSFDPYGANHLDPDRRGRYDFCSAIEVFEHLPDPVRSLEDIVGMCTGGPLTIMIKTSTTDKAVSPSSRLGWWYAGPRNGHISLFSTAALQLLAERCGLSYLAGFRNNAHFLGRGVSRRQVTAAMARRKSTWASTWTWRLRFPA